MTCWSLVVYLLKCCLKFIHLIFSTLTYPFTNYPLLRGRGKKKNTLCVWGIFSTGLKKKLKNVQFILPKPMFTFLNNFDYFSLSTNSIFQIFLITFKVILCLLMSDIYHLQWILDYTWDWEKSLEKREEKSEYLQYLSFFHTMPSIFWRNTYRKNTPMKWYYCFKR